MAPIESEYRKSRLYQRTVEAKKVLDKEKARMSIIQPSKSPSSTKVSSSASSFMTTSSKRKTFGWFRSNSAPIIPLDDPPALPSIPIFEENPASSISTITRPPPTQARRESGQSFRSVSRNSLDTTPTPARISPKLSPLILVPMPSTQTLKPTPESDSSATPSLENGLSTPSSSLPSPTTPHHSQLDLPNAVYLGEAEMRRSFSNFFSKNSSKNNTQEMKKKEEKSVKPSNNFFRNLLGTSSPPTTSSKLVKSTPAQATLSKNQVPLPKTPKKASKTFFGSMVRSKSDINASNGLGKNELPALPIRTSSRTLPNLVRA